MVPSDWVDDGWKIVNRTGMAEEQTTDRQTDRVTRSMTDPEKRGLMRAQWLCDHYLDDQSQAITGHLTVLTNEVAVSGSNPPIISPSRPP